MAVKYEKVIKSAVLVDNTLNESFNPDDFLKLSFRDIKKANAKNWVKTLQDIDNVIRQTELSSDKHQRKVHKKATKYYEKLVAIMNK